MNLVFTFRDALTLLFILPGVLWWIGQKIRQK